MVENVMVQRLRVRPHVQQLVRRESAIRRRGDIADVVRTGAAGNKAQFLDASEYLDDIARLELADLEVAASRNVGVTSAAVRRESGEPVQLRGTQLAGRNSQSQHETVLRGRDVEQAVKFEAIGVFGIGRPIFLRVLEQAIPRLERILVV